MSWKWNFIINVLGKGGAVLVAFVFTPILVRMMGIEGFALVAFFTTFLSITFVLDFAFGITMTRELARFSLAPEKADEARDLTRSLEYFYLGIGITIALLLAASASWITRNWLILHALSFADVRNAVMLMGGAIGLQAPLGMYTGAMYGLDRQPMLNLAQFLLALARFGGAVLAMLAFGADVVVFFGWQLGFSAVQTLIMRHLVWRNLSAGTRPARFCMAALRNTFQFTSRVTGAAVSGLAINQLDKLVLSKLMPLPLLGTYQLGNQLGNATKLLATLVETVVMPRMTIHSEQKDEAALAALYHESCQLSALMVLPFAAAIMLFAIPLLTLWLGNAGLAQMAAPVTVLLVLGSACNALIRVPGGLTLAQGWSAFSLYESVISGVIYVPMMILLIHRDGAVGAAWAWLVLNAGCLVVDMPVIHSRFLKSEFTGWLIWSMAVPSAICFGLFAATRLLLPPMPPLGATAVVGVTWITATAACGLAMPQTRAVVLRGLKRA